MGKQIIGLLAVILFASASAETTVTYVGEGRYACSGPERECEPVRRRNDELELQRQQVRELEYQRLELKRQTESIEEQSHMEMERSSRY